MLVWTREFPLDGEPADVAELVLGYGRWMAETPDVPKLLMTMDSGAGLGSPEMISWAAETFASAQVVSVGPGGHQAPEDQARSHRDGGGGLAHPARTGRGGPGRRVSRDVDEVELVARAVDGDKAALEEVICLLQDPLYRLALRMVRRPSDAEDATQEILIGVITRLAAWRGESKLLTWAYRVGVNYLLNLRRGSGGEATSLSFDEFRDGWRKAWPTPTTEVQRLRCWLTR